LALKPQPITFFGMDTLADISGASIDLLRTMVARLTRELAAAEKSKAEYMQNVAHQLAAPINAIKLNIDSIKNPKVHVSRKKILMNSIYCQGTILAHLIKNFSFMSHLDAEHNLDSFREKPEEIDLYLLCVNFANDFQPTASYKDQKIIVEEDQFTRSRRPRILAIKNLLSQVVYNLLENATKYADSDSTISVGMQMDSSSVILNFVSTGIPITASECGRIFDRSERGVSAKALNPAGTGFGLYIARRIMEIHRGTITVSTLGRTSTFRVNSPRMGTLK